MFTGIIEAICQITKVESNFGNKTFTLKAPFIAELSLGQSIAHDGVCLTVEKIHADDSTYELTAIAETLAKTNLDERKIGDWVNIERCMKADGRFDGHIVQGHVDSTAICSSIIALEGSTLFTFEFDPQFQCLVVEKGSVCINGISLTLVSTLKNSLSVALIPYTLQHTNMGHVSKGNKVNLEFDIVGKYLNKLAQSFRN